MRGEMIDLETGVENSYQKVPEHLRVELGVIAGVRYFMLGPDVYIDNGDGPILIPAKTTSDSYVLDMDKREER
ncbi:hypothetical protein GOV07_03565 [Candidatus Woesearchaeota archaeon]|nr:hypothetical protein [Candidatus Woesearchaeota archaeon]